MSAEVMFFAVKKVLFTVCHNPLNNLQHKTCTDVLESFNRYVCSQGMPEVVMLAATGNMVLITKQLSF